MTEPGGATGPNPGGLTPWEIRQHFDGKVAHELNLILHRMTWLVTSQSFLFLVWGGHLDNFKLSLVISLVGFTISSVAFVAIGAALRMLDRMGARYLDTVEGALQLPKMGYGRQDWWTTPAGNLTALLIPPVFMGVWAGAFSRAGGRNPLLWDHLLNEEDRCAVKLACKVAAGAALFSLLFMWRPWPFGKGKQAKGFPELLQSALNSKQSEPPAKDVTTPSPPPPAAGD